MAKAKADTTNSDEEQSAEDSGAVSAATALEKRANNENGASIEKQAASASEHAALELARILVLDQSLARRKQHRREPPACSRVGLVARQVAEDFAGDDRDTRGNLIERSGKTRRRDDDRRGFAGLLRSGGLGVNAQRERAEHDC